MKFSFRLYVCGHNPASVRAEANLRHFCRHWLNDDVDFEVIDVLEHPEELASKHIIVAPTLILEAPTPQRRFFGDLNDLDQLARELNITRKRESS